MRHADEALYAAKAAGKGRIMVRGEKGVLPVDAPAGTVEVGSPAGVAW
jgi:hypothetical protein